MTRKDFFRTSSAAAAGILSGGSFHILRASSTPTDTIIGHNDYSYRVHKDWGNLNPSQTPVKDCHEMVMDKRGRLIMVTNETKNNIIIYDKSGKLLDSWGTSFPGGHGLSLWEAGDEEFLFICDTELGKVVKTTLDGKELMTISHPSKVGAYKEGDPFKPTESAVGPNGDIYITDGYGSQWVLQYSPEGEFIRKFGGKGAEDHQLDTAHGICIDDRNPTNPTLLVTSRSQNCFKRFTLEGEYLATIFLPGAYVCRPVIKESMLYSGVCFSRLRYLNKTPDSGFVTILNGKNEVVSNPGGTEPTYENGKLGLMIQDTPIFKHCHDVCIDEDENIYVCQWNADRSYPIKLERV